jgi:dTDP-glucose 4,6-dehydratase
VLSGVALVALAVPFAVIALVIRATSSGPVFYRQERMGLDGKSFVIYKFRSMYQDAERETGPVWAVSDDPRCTPIGRLLRRTNVDELPQLWNVFRGDMSLVGPRPERPFFVSQFKQRIPQYMLRHKVRAGLTGWAQVNGWRGQHVDREADRVRPVLHRELVGGPRREDHVAHAPQGLLPPARLLTAGAPAARAGASPMQQRVVITGAAGFIGSHLAEALLDRGYAVIGIDNLLTGDIANIAHLRNRDFEFIKHDVTNYIYIDGPVDYVLHWASPASPIDYLELPIPTLKVGALGTHKALGLAKAKNARFVLASTSEVYGDPLEHPQRETYWGNVNPIGPRGVYDEAKRFAEAMTVAYHRYHGLDAKIVRIFNTYGPRMRVRDGRAVPAFISQALRNEDVTVFGDGSQTRSFTYISDLVDGIIRLMLSDVNEPVNIGNPREMTIEEIAGTIVRMTGSSSRIVYRELPVDDPKVRQPDITRARTLLGWEPRVALEEGLTETIAYFRTRLGATA